MNTLFFAIFLLVPALSVADQKPPAPRSHEAVIAADNNWSLAEQDGNSQYVEHLLLDGYKSIGSSGKITTKAQIIEGAKKRGKSAKYAKLAADWESKHPSKANVTIFGDTAVLTWVSRNAGSTPPVDSSDIFVYRDGEWRAIYSQHSTAPERKH